MTPDHREIQSRKKESAGLYRGCERGRQGKERRGEDGRGGVSIGSLSKTRKTYTRYCTLKPRQHCFIRLTCLYALMELNAYNAITPIRASIWIMGGRSSDPSIARARTKNSFGQRDSDMVFRFFVP